MGALAGLMLVVIGCDKQPASPSASDQADTAADSSARPASTGPRDKFPLMIMPLTVSLPADWKLDPPVSPSFLEGPAPSGNLEISLSIMDAMDDRQRQLFVAGSLDESQKHPRRIQVAQFTSKSGLPIVARITYATAPTHAGSPPPTTLPSQLLSWNFIIFVPYKHKFIPCSFDLIGLTEQQYGLDQSLIRTMVDSAEPSKTAAFQ
jgi:hypothetical protein